MTFIEDISNNKININKNLFFASSINLKNISDQVSDLGVNSKLEHLF